MIDSAVSSHTPSRGCKSSEIKFVIAVCANCFFNLFRFSSNNIVLSFGIDVTVAVSINVSSRSVSVVARVWFQTKRGEVNTVVSLSNKDEALAHKEGGFRIVALDNGDGATNVSTTGKSVHKSSRTLAKQSISRVLWNIMRSQQDDYPEH
mmetsp:Transcript_15268/g.25153  ORF Transcript_15268/g.25153 Transcript_15268/m.25153 type:complete len:150 (+) Transcript_15268:3707-4156(+)